MTRPYAEVIGDPIAHSKSPLIHNFWLQKLGIDAEYLATHVSAEGLPEYFTRRRKDAKWLGCNVTIPHKVAVLDFVDDAKLGLLDASNTIVRRENGLVAFNTDVAGILEPLAKYPLPAGFQDGDRAEAAIVQIIGAGGAARAALHATSDAGYFHAEIYNRSADRAQTLAAQTQTLRRWAFSLDDLASAPMQPDHPFSGWNVRYLVINASAMGMGGQDPVPIDLSGYPSSTIIFDMVYAPLETPLLAQARRLGLTIIDGLEMLVGQAAAAFEIFFGEPAPREYDAQLRSLLVA